MTIGSPAAPGSYDGPRAVQPEPGTRRRPGTAIPHPRPDASTGQETGPRTPRPARPSPRPTGPGQPFTAPLAAPGDRSSTPTAHRLSLRSEMGSDTPRNGVRQLTVFP